MRIDDRPQRDRSSLLGRAVALSVLSIGINGVLGGTAVLVGLASDSLSLLGFGLNAAIDSAASVALVWRFRTEVREPHRAERIEALAETAVGVVMLVLAAYLGISAIGALASNAQPEPSDIRTVLLVVALLVLPPLAIAKHRVARSLGSGALRADSILTAIAAVLALIGLVSLALEELVHVTWGDAAGAVVIAVIIAREGWGSVQVARSGVSPGV
ncbi:MAG TPA: cation transporter [Candidatus Limnocylindrales bacterium]|nr:cation transporter [Candidatus Limnocylindrales bacterium]